SGQVGRQNPDRTPPAIQPIHCRSQRDDRSWTTGESSRRARKLSDSHQPHPDPLLRYFLGDIVHVYCKKAVSTRPFDVEETGAVLLTFGNGAVGTCIFSDAAASPHSWEGASKFLVFSLNIHFKLILWTAGENPNIPHTGETAYTFFGTKGTVSIPQLKLSSANKTFQGFADPTAAEQKD
ncbi:hypothetical protein CPB85DRAFT_1559819, partial [Mucidula mucida]